MPEKGKTFTDILDAVGKAVDKFGIDGAYNIIASVEKTSPDDIQIKSIERYIINTVCHVFDVSTYQLLTSTDKSEKRMNAISVCAYFFKHFCRYSYTKIGNVLNKDVSNIHRYEKRISTLNPKMKAEKDMMGKMIEAQRMICQEYQAIKPILI